MESIKISNELSQKLAVAQRLSDTLVFRTKDGLVFSIEVGESILSDSINQVGAKVSQIAPIQKHIGIVQGEQNIGEVLDEAQKMILMAIEERSAMPKPHLSVPNKAIA